MLEPVGEVQDKLVVFAEMYDSRGVRANEDAEVLGTGGGMYVPVVMSDLANSGKSQKKAQ